MNIHFYKDVRGFDTFSDLTDPMHYTEVPAEWYVMVTDIKGSTKVIAEGRYKDVNLAGASAIIAILNIAGDIALPYVFGGDGVTMMIPPELLDKTQETLAAVRRKVQEAFGLELRDGCVPVKLLYERGATLRVAKFNLSPHMSEAVFQGDALALAERWLKEGGGTVLRSPETPAVEPDLHGLECRWQPVENRNGKMISLLVRVLPERAGQAREIYAGILQDIGNIYPDDAKTSPIRSSGMQLGFSPKVLGREAALRGGGTVVARTLYLLKMMAVSLIGTICIKNGWRIGGFDGRRYMSELVANSDCRKFDEMLRMVLDSTEEQQEALEHMLEGRRQKGEISYGLHLSPQALMTCLVFSASGHHVHFVDGADGGYALAAQQMKQQARA